MNRLAAADLFDLWEHGRPLTPTGRCCALLLASGVTETVVDGLSVGQGDALVMELRAGVFGTEVAGVVDCPGCAERLDVAFGLDDVRSPAPGDPAAPVEVEADGWIVRARPPTLEDLRCLDRYGPHEDRRAALLARCVLDAERAGVPVAAQELPEPVVARVVVALAEADPQAETRLGLGCAACGRTWSTVFDVVAFFWAELEDWAWRTAQDVAELAARYGWSEAEVLAMTPWRRQLYLELGRT